MFEPAPPARNREDAIVRQVEDVEVELRRVDQRLRTLGWSAPSPRRLSVADEWALTAGTIEPPGRDYGDGDAIARTVLHGKRDALLEELRRLRAQLVGQPGAPRRGGWG